MLGLAGGVVGVVAGAALARSVGPGLANSPIGTDLPLLGAGLAAAVVVAIVFTVIPAALACMGDPADTLRAE